MARGWESKAVEEQQAEAAAQKSFPDRPVAPKLSAKQKQRQSLELSRKRVLQQLQVAKHSAHRLMLEKALADLETRLSQLE